MANPFIRTTVQASLNVNRAAQASERAERRFLFRFGGYVRKVARRSIKKAKYIYSKPGDPPRGKLGWLRESIEFSVERDQRSVIIGPEARKTRTPQNAAKLHEFGGTANRRAQRVLIPKRELRSSSGVPPKERPRSVPWDKKLAWVFVPAKRKYEERPYMGPALKKGADKPQSDFWLGTKRS